MSTPPKPAEPKTAKNAATGDMTGMLGDMMQASMRAWSQPRPQVWADWTKAWLSWQASLVDILAASGKDAASSDPRFRDAAWSAPPFRQIRQTYEAAARAMVDTADAAGLDPHDQRKLSFYARVMADSLSPSNVAALNPEVLARIRETGGRSVMAGMQNLVEDIRRGAISTTDGGAFTVGGNLANTPGDVVFRNALIELIQYAPRTETVSATPILIVPPCVNKFYIFDINERKSMVRWLVDQGHTVFIVAWRNPGPDFADYGWDDYIDTGIFTALKSVLKIAGAEQAHVLSWCNAATLLVAALAVIPDDLKAQVASATFLAGMIDFAGTGGIDVYVDAPQIWGYNQRLAAAKVVPGRDIGQAMAMLHVNESIWNFVVGNYLKGDKPPAFDILFWNADTQNLPPKWYKTYIEDMYLENRLPQPGALSFCGRPVDTKRIDMPCYFLGATGDHIVPWKTSYLALDHVSGDRQFVLTEGGHVSGTTINHPDRNRRSFLAGGDLSGDATAWQASATRHDGSWWPHWLGWLNSVDGSTRVPAPKSTGSKALPPLAPAPGTYVHEDVPQDGTPYERSRIE